MTQNFVRITLSIPRELKARMDQYPEKVWSPVFRVAVQKEIERMNQTSTHNPIVPPPRLEVGKHVRVWKTTGVRLLSRGPQTSERVGGDFPDVEPDEDLLVLRKDGSQYAYVRRASGEEIRIHLNHINPTSSYYADRDFSGFNVSQAKGSSAQATSTVAADLEALERLVALKERGVLTEEEFADQKRRILSGKA